MGKCPSLALLLSLAFRHTAEILAPNISTKTRLELRTSHYNRHHFQSSKEIAEGSIFRISFMAPKRLHRCFLFLKLPFSWLFSERRYGLKHSCWFPTGGVKPRQAAAGVTFTANECNIWVFITTRLKSTNRTQYKDQ